MNQCCDRCEAEVDDAEVMPDPVSGAGALCPECYHQANDRAQEKAAIEWIKSRLPSMDLLLDRFSQLSRIDRKTARLENNCHPAATALADLLQAGLKARVRRGHWLGRNAQREDVGFAQHSWVQVEVPLPSGALILDPTQYVFTGEPPHIAITTADDRRYDAGSYRLRALVKGPIVMPPRRGKTMTADLPLETKRFLRQRYGKRDWSRWTAEEMHAIGNTNPQELGEHARPLFKALVASGRPALIPIDARREVLS